MPMHGTPAAPLIRVVERCPDLLRTLEQLLELSSADLGLALAQASDLVAAALKADKVDMFMYEPARDSLVALGSSHQPLSDLQRRHGLDVLPVSNGGRAVQAFQEARTFMSGHTDRDPEELRGIKEALGVRSTLALPLYVGEQRRGVVLVASRQPEYWSDEDATFMQSVARWVGVIAHRAELSTENAHNALEQGRRTAAEELVTVLAHDLRNYLAPIDLRLRSVRRRAEREGRAADLQDLDITLKGLTRFATLIGDLLDVARLDHGIFSMQAQPLPLLALLEETAAALETPEHPIAVEASGELVVVADPLRIRQCLENLLGNAIKHSPKSGKVVVTLSRGAGERGECALVEVVDEGPGVPEQLLPHLFERYVKGRKSIGLGLGLYLAKRIVSMHRGELSVESKPGVGARFRLTLPCHTE
jgi:two-component system OmpR family sensor kinase